MLFVYIMMHWVAFIICLIEHRIESLLDEMLFKRGIYSLFELNTTRSKS
jgi:hypothetical protein